ncbi:AAA family ATPase [Streptomyces sp. Agncl-13]|uniref:AAA family ATPase n=1 Tax=Streptomyces sp. Agncl-13 TaxID=3400628 RepID=UPI003A8667E2
MKHLALIEVIGLFNTFDHKITLSDEPYATIISGPNGSGKTQTLKLVKSVFDFDFAYLASAPYQELRLTFQNGQKLEVIRRTPKKREASILAFRGTSRDGREHSPIHISSDEIIEHSQTSTTSTMSISPTWISPADAMDTHYITDLAPPNFTASWTPAFEEQLPPERKYPIPKNSWLRTMLNTEAVMIDTKRLHTRPPGSPRHLQTRRHKHRSILDMHLARIDAQVAQAREASLAISQERDQSFPMRILSDKPGQSYRRPASMERLQRMYNEVHALGAELHSNGLSALPELMEFPDRDLTPFERGILTQFVQDWRKKFEPLLPVNDRLQALRAILKGKLRFKTVQYDSTRGLEFTSTINGEQIPVASLSSGEQHLVVLFTALLFSATPGSIVLIDEPEISMHAAWQHAFLDDISRVAKIQDLQVILATHSAAIVKGHWELVQEIGVK